MSVSYHFKYTWQEWSSICQFADKFLLDVAQGIDEQNVTARRQFRIISNILDGSDPLFVSLLTNFC